MQARRRSLKIVAHLAVENTPHSHMADARTRVITSMNGLDTGIKGVPVRIWQTSDMPQLHLATLIRAVPRPTCEELIDYSVVDFTVAYVGTSAAFSTVRLPPGEVGPVRPETPMYLEDVSFESGPLLAKDGDARTTKKAAADVICNVIPSHPSTSHAVDTSAPSGSDADRPLVVDRTSTSSGVHVNASSATFSTTSALPFEMKPVSGTLALLLTSQPSAVTASYRTVESTSAPKSGCGSVKPSAARKKLPKKCVSKGFQEA